MEKSFGRYPVIILDGPDGVGKTTLARELCKQLSGKYLHLGYRWKDRIFDYHTAAIRFASRSTVPVVIDRWWPSEAVYSSVFRNGSAWPLQGRLADRIARKLGAVYVYCLPDKKHNKRFEDLKNKRYEMYTDMQDVSNLFNKLWYGDLNHEDTGNYIDFLIRSGGVKDLDGNMYYKISEHGHYLDLYAEQVIDHCRVRQELQYPPALLHNEWNLAGHLMGSEYLIVGEQVNPKSRELFWPFYEHKNSSLYLTECLHEADISEDKLMWCNAFDHTGEFNKHIGYLAEALKVVTLGGHAADAVTEHGIAIHKELPHPSYVKRFKKVNLVEALKHAIC